MEWILFDAMYPLLYSQASAGTPASGAPAPTESDLWIARQIYEFAGRRSVCGTGTCGAALSRRLRLAIVPGHHGRPGQPGAPWHIVVAARCRGLRRHRHTAAVTEAQDGLRFGELRAVGG